MTFEANDDGGAVELPEALTLEDMLNLMDAEEGNEVEYNYTRLAIASPNGDIVVQVEFPAGHGLDAARALASAGLNKSIMPLLATGAEHGDQSILDYLESQDADVEGFIRGTAIALGTWGDVELADSDEQFFG